MPQEAQIAVIVQYDKQIVNSRVTNHTLLLQFPYFSITYYVSVGVHIRSKGLLQLPSCYYVLMLLKVDREHI